MTKKMLLLVAVVVPALCLICATPAQAQTLTSIQLTPADPSVPAGLTQQFTATGTYSDGSTQNLTTSVTWTSSSTATATISSVGLATGMVAGTTTIMATSGSISGSTVLTVTASGLVGWWQFHDGTGTTAVDSSGNGNNATLANGVTWVTGQNGEYAISANGSNQYVSIPAVNLSGTSVVTWAAWVNRTYSSAGGHTLFENSANFNSSTTGFGFFPDDGVDCPTSSPMMTGVHGNVGYTLNCYVQPSSSVWHHIAVVYNKTLTGTSVISLYIDGVLQTPAQYYYTATNTNAFGDNPLYVFSRGGTTQYSAGEMDDLRLYNVALTATQIEAIYQAGNPQLVSIAVTPANASVAKGDTQQFTASGTYSNGTIQNLTSTVTWGSSNTAAATITSGGLATGTGTGTTTISATSGAISGSTGLTVTGPVLVSIAVTPANASINSGSTQQYTATGTYSDSSTQNLTSSVTWSSTNTAAATITSAGLATAVGTGTTTIEASMGSVSGSTNLTVTAILESISVTPANPSVAKGNTQQFTATGMYSDGGTLNMTGSVTWVSTSTSVATIGSTGLATGVAAGSTTITATYGSITGMTGLTVTPPVLVSIAVTPANSSVIVGATQQFTATGTYSDSSTQNLTSSVTWSSSSTAVATITSAGLATGVATGSTTIKATSGSISGSTGLTVTSAIPAPVGWWKFNDGSGTTAVDSSGNGNNATLVNGVTWVTGQNGEYAVSTNGVNQYVSIPAVNLSGTSVVTWAAWVNRTYSTGGGHTLFENSANFNSSTTGFGFFPDDGIDCPTSAPMMTGVNGNVGYTLNCYAQPSSGAWHHIAVVYNKTQPGTSVISLYIDGVLQTPAVYNYTATNTNAFGDNPSYVFSRGGTTEYTAGEMDDLRLYNVALTATQIQQIYEAGTATLVSIAVTPANASVPSGETQQFTATGTYSNGGTQNLTSSVTWSSTNTAAATITSGGLATGVAAGGSTTITATSGSISGSTGLTVTAPVLVSIAVTPANGAVATGSTLQFTATGTYSDSSTQNLTSSVTWSSTNTAAATIASGGLATGVAKGSTTIQATSGSISGSTGLTVTAILVSIAVTPANTSVAIGQTQQFTATGTYSDSSTLNLTSSVTWSSTNTAAATITSGGLATGVAAGSTTIMATSGSISGSTGLTVSGKALVSIALTPASSSIVTGATLQFTATGTYSDSSTSNLTSSVTWKSTNTAAATITSGGLATGVATGSTTIMATSGSISGSTGLTVGTTGQFVQSTAGDNGAASSSETWMNSDVTAGDLILVFSHWDNQALTATVSDSLGNTYLPIGGPVSAGTTARFQAWYAKNIVGGAAPGITVTYSGKTTTFSVVDAMEWSGLDQTAPLNVFATAVGSGATQNSGLASPSTAAYATFIGLFGFSSYASPYAAGGGYTFRGYDASTFWEDMSVTSTGSYNATATSSDSTTWAAWVIGFKSAIQPPISLSLNPLTVSGGSASVGTVTLNAVAPAGGATVNLTSSNTAVATVPATVTVASGATEANFTVSTSGVGVSTSVAISATYNSQTQSISLTVVPAAMSQLASDNFNRANAPTLGINWAPLVGVTSNVALQVASDQIESTAISPSIAKEMYYGGLNWTPDQYSQVEIMAATGTGSGYEGPAVRMSSNDTHYACVVYNVGSGSSAVSIILDNAGTYTTLASSTTATVKAGDTVRCTVQGTTLTMTDQTSSSTLLTASDSTIPSGYPGLVDSAGTAAVTNYVMANWAGGSTVTPLSAQELASDNFNRANALNLGPNWDIGTGHGPIQIVSDQIQPYPAGGTQPSKEHYVAYGAFPNDQWSQIQVVYEDTVGDVAVEVRASDTADNMYVCDVNLTGPAGTAQTRIDRVIGGTITYLVLDSTWSAVSAGDYIRGQVQGSLISLIDVTTGQLLLTTFDTSLASGYPGISMQADTGNPSDHIAGNWSGGGFGQ